MQARDQSPPAFSMGKGARGTMIRKYRDLKDVGPFNYNQTFVDKKKEPQFSMGAKLGSSLVNKVVVSTSPDCYNPNATTTKMQAPQFKIGTGKRGTSYDARKAALVPAPGTYELKSKAFENIEKPKFHMGQKITFDDTKKYIHSIPGPGSHEPDAKTVKNRSPVFTMGSRLAGLKDTTKAPGPGTYVNSAEKLKTSSPSFGFGSSQRPAIGGNGKNQVPGPGQYKLPSKIQDVPAYALPNRKDESKYV